MKRTSIFFVWAVFFALVLTGCEGMLTSTASPSPAPISLPTTSAFVSPSPTLKPAPTREERTDERKSTPSPTPEPALAPSDLPDLTPPPGGWIALRTPEKHLALISPDGSRFVPLTEREVSDFTWSPDGHWLAFVVKGQLALASIESSRLIPLTDPGTVRSPGLTWSQDSGHLAYLHGLERDLGRSARPDALYVLDIATYQTITVSTYPNTRPDERAVLCPQPFPFPVLPVREAGFSPVVRLWDVQDREVLVELFLSSSSCGHYLWLPDGRGVIFANEETGKEGIKIKCVQATQACSQGVDAIIHPTSLALWRMGDEALTVLLEGTQRQFYYPTRWLPNGQIEVHVSHFEKTVYEGSARPEHTEYRHFYVSEEEELWEAAGSDLPWWTAGGFLERLSEAHLPQSTSPATSYLSSWEVGPDGKSIIFTWRWVVDKEGRSAIYLWRSEGEPRHLSMGSIPNGSQRWLFFSQRPLPLVHIGTNRRAVVRGGPCPGKSI